MVNSKSLSSVPSNKYRNLVKVSMGAGTWTELTRSTTSLVTSVKISRKWWWWWYLLITSTKAYCNNQVQKNEEHHHPGRRTVFGQNEPKDLETWDENYNAGQARLAKGYFMWKLKWPLKWPLIESAHRRPKLQLWDDRTPRLTFTEHRLLSDRLLCWNEAILASYPFLVFFSNTSLLGDYDYFKHS